MPAFPPSLAADAESLVETGTGTRRTAAGPTWRGLFSASNTEYERNQTTEYCTCKGTLYGPGNYPDPPEFDSWRSLLTQMQNGNFIAPPRRALARRHITADGI
jgi:hypothetical protein